jgi:hypothetical protein
VNLTVNKLLGIEVVIPGSLRSNLLYCAEVSSSTVYVSVCGVTPSSSYITLPYSSTFSEVYSLSTIEPGIVVQKDNLFGFQVVLLNVIDVNVLGSSRVS